jgi:hypothetical protein
LARRQKSILEIVPLRYWKGFIVIKKHTAAGLLVLILLATLSWQAMAQKAAPVSHWVSAWTTALYAPNPMPETAAEPAI